MAPDEQKSLNAKRDFAHDMITEALAALIELQTESHNKGVPEFICLRQKHAIWLMREAKKLI